MCFFPLFCQFPRDVPSLQSWKTWYKMLQELCEMLLYSKNWNNTVMVSAVSCKPMVYTFVSVFFCNAYTRGGGTLYTWRKKSIPFSKVIKSSTLLRVLFTIIKEANPACNYMFKVNSRNSGTTCEILTIKSSCRQIVPDLALLCIYCKAKKQQPSMIVRLGLNY